MLLCSTCCIRVDMKSTSLAFYDTTCVCIVKEGQFLTFYHFVGKKQSDKKFGKKNAERGYNIAGCCSQKKREK